MNDDQGQIDETVALIRQEWHGSAKLGVVLGTGLGSLSDHAQVDVDFPYHELPGFPRTTALAHRGRLICGTLQGTPAILMDGRCHIYEGYTPAELGFPIRVMRSLGINTLIATNAAGGLNPQFATGDVVAIDDHVDLMSRFAFSSPKHAFRAVPKSRTPYDRALLNIAHEVARSENVLLRRGVYVAMTGPSYETRSEYRFLRRIGGDVVGMSTVPEVTAARELGVKCLALSTITNVAKPDVANRVDAHDVVTVAQHASTNVLKIVMGLAREIRDA